MGENEPMLAARLAQLSQDEVPALLADLATRLRREGLDVQLRQSRQRTKPMAQVTDAVYLVRLLAETPQEPQALRVHMGILTGGPYQGRAYLQASWGLGSCVLDTVIDTGADLAAQLGSVLGSYVAARGPLSM